MTSETLSLIRMIVKHIENGIRATAILDPFCETLAELGFRDLSRAIANLERRNGPKAIGTDAQWCIAAIARVQEMERLTRWGS